MRIIKLYTGEEVMIDEEDFDRVDAYSWSRKRGKNTLYAQAWVGGRRTSLHRFLMGAGPGEYVDHKNGNGLDNRRENLRFATNSQNLANQRLRKDNVSGYRGVFRWNSRWRAVISLNYQKIHIGMFDTPEEAAIAYDQKAIEIFGQFAALNFEKNDV